MMYKICDRCGSHLDFGERCDCGDKDENTVREMEEKRNERTAELERRAGRESN